MKLLDTTSDRIRIQLLTGLLKENGIPCCHKDRASGGYLRVTSGNSMFGTDIYVDDDDFDRAREIMDAYFTQEGAAFDGRDIPEGDSLAGDDIPDGDSSLERRYRNVKRGIRAAVILVLVLIAAVAAVNAAPVVRFLLDRLF